MANLWIYSVSFIGLIYIHTYKLSRKRVGKALVETGPSNFSHVSTMPHKDTSKPITSLEDIPQSNCPF